jgi:hypothetical protein
LAWPEGAEKYQKVPNKMMIRADAGIFERSTAGCQLYSPDQGKYKTNFQILRAGSLRKWVLSK